MLDKDKLSQEDLLRWIKNSGIAEIEDVRRTLRKWTDDLENGTVVISMPDDLYRAGYIDKEPGRTAVKINSKGLLFLRSSSESD